MNTLAALLVLLIESVILCGTGHYVDKKLHKQGLGICIWLLGAIPICGFVVAIICTLLAVLPMLAFAAFA